MKNKHFLVFFVVILIALALAACERSASTPAPDGGEAAFPTLETTPDLIDELQQHATQTAQALADESAAGAETESQPEAEESAEEPEAPQDAS